MYIYLVCSASWLKFDKSLRKSNGVDVGVVVNKGSWKQAVSLTCVSICLVLVGISSYVNFALA